MLARTMATTPPAEAPPDIVLQQRPGIDQEGEICGGVARSTGGRDEDLGEHRQQEDRFDHHHHADRAGQMRQRDKEELREHAGAVHAGGFLLLMVERLHGGQQDQQRERQPLPGYDRDDGRKRVLARTNRPAAYPARSATAPNTP